MNKIRDEVEKAFGPDWYENWHQGVLEWTSIPHQINVKDILRLFTWAKSIDLIDFAKWRYEMMDSYSHWIPGKRVCEFDPNKMKQILKNSPFVERIPELLIEAHNTLKNEEGNRLSLS